MTLKEFVEDYADVDLKIKDLSRIITNSKEALANLAVVRSELIVDNNDILEEGIFDTASGHVAIVSNDRGLDIVFHPKRTL